VSGIAELAYESTAIAPSPCFFVSVASKGLSFSLCLLESAFTDAPASVDSKRFGGNDSVLEKRTRPPMVLEASDHVCLDQYGAACEHSYVRKSEKKLEGDRQGAMRVAEIIYAGLQKLPEAEQLARTEAIQKIKVRNRNTPKRSSIPPNSREHSRAAEPRRKRARP
jgi:hypothetical protein